ncbi:MAG: hypothetical protein IJ308_04365 [Clostridia bacterium]|nr:hypothetical protein [Clostridia bacterium]
MNIIQGIKEKIKNKRLTKLEKDLLSLRNKMQFDPRLLSLAEVETAEAFSRRIYEYKVWNMGNAGLLCRFYRAGNAIGGKYDYNKLNYFWTKAPTTRRMIHCGIPGLISSRMADILFKGGVAINVVLYKNENGESLAEDKAGSKKSNEFMKELQKKLNLQTNLQTAAVNESWGGHCFFRLSHDSSVSAYPILETFDITKAEVIKERGITKAIVFKTWYEHRGKTYRLDEIYSTTETGDACVTYRLFTFDGDKERECELLSIPQTSESFFFDGRGNQKGIALDENQRFVYTGLKGMLAFEKPNKAPSQEFPSSNYGASDYEGALDEFDALDEITSANVREIRTNETKRYIPDVMLPRDDKTGEPLPFDEFADCYVKVKGDSDQDAENKIDVSEISDKTASYLEKWKSSLSIVCNKAKISPYSLGITWLEAVGPSAESQLERNKTTIDMRKGKLELWTPLLEELLLRALQLNTWMRKEVNEIRERQKGVPDIEFTEANTSIQLDFGEYVEEGVSTRITTWGGAKTQRVASTNEAVRQIHPDWTEKQIEDEVNIIRFEDGVSVDNPANLPALTGAGGPITE